MTQPESNSPETAARPERVNPKTLLADLESRQDELLRLLDELEERTRQAIAQLSPAASARPNVPPSDLKAA